MANPQVGKRAALGLTSSSDATAPDAVKVTFSGDVTALDPENAANYTLTIFTGQGAPVQSKPLAGIATVKLAADKETVFITLDQRPPNAITLRAGQWIQMQALNTSSFTQVHDAGDALGNIALNTGSIATSAGGARQAVEDLAAFSLLTEEIGYSPSPLAKPSAGGGAAAPAAGGMLGQIAMKAVSDVLGWQVKSDPKGFLGALNASFKLEEIEGHTRAIWTPRTYAIQTDLSGGITGAQASVYERAKDALDRSLPLLEGLYPLFQEAKDEDVAALRATVRSQFTDLINELGLQGGPRIARVTQLFFLLLGGTPLPTTPPAPGTPSPVVTDPDLIGGSLGNLRLEFGFGKDDDQVNTVEDEQDLTNFRIVSDYVTSLAQSWLNNLQFFGLQTKTPFFGTQLVLLSRQLSVIAESVNEVRFNLDSVFIGPAERQTLQINFGPPAPASTPPMFLEDLLCWVDTFASEEGPRLIDEGGKFGVAQSFVPIGTQLQTLVAGAVNPLGSLPRGYQTKRVQRSLEELRDQLQELVNLARPIQHVITPEPQHELAVLAVTPDTVPVSFFNSTTPTVVVVGTGFLDDAVVDVSMPGGVASIVVTDTIPGDNLLIVVFQQFQPGTGPAIGTYDVTVRQAVQSALAPIEIAVLSGGFTVT